MIGMESILETESADDIKIIKILNDRLDAVIAPDFKEKMTTLLQNGRQMVIFDLSKVEAIDSTGLGALVACLKMVKTGRRPSSGNELPELQSEPGEIVLCGANPTVITLLQLTRMDRIFHVYDSIQDGLRFLKSNLT